MELAVAGAKINVKADRKMNDCVIEETNTAGYGREDLEEWLFWDEGNTKPSLV